MAQTDTLDRIASIVDALGPLGQATRGTPLRSDDWNKLVGAVLDLARIARTREQGVESSLEARFSPRDHTHEGAADLSWFDAATRARLEGRVENEVEWRNDLRALRTDMDGLKRGLDDLRGRIDGLQRDVDQLDDRDSTRDANIKRIETHFGGLADLSRDFSTLNTKFDTVGQRVGEALDLRDRLVDGAGQPIDFVALRGKVDGLETLRDNLKSANGALGTFRDVEKRLERIEGNNLGRAELDETVRRRLLEGTLLADALGSSAVFTTTLQKFDGKIAPLAQRVDALAGENAGVRSKVDAQQGELGTLRDRVAVNETQTARIPGMSTTLDGLNTRVTSIDTRVQTQTVDISKLTVLSSRVDTLDLKVGKLDALPGRFSKLESDFAVANTEIGRFSALDSRVTAVEAFEPRLSATSARIDALDTFASTQKTGLANVSSEVALIRAESSTRDNRLARLETDSTKTENRLNAVDANIGSLSSVNSRIDRLERVGTTTSSGTIAIDRIGGISRPG